eukprot:Nk52_evm14s358 gene=Nk52_evmTU14s358
MNGGVVVLREGISNILEGFTRTKPLSFCQCEEELQGESSNKNSLKRDLSIYDLIGIGVGFCLGAGVFITSGVISRDDSGPSVVLSFLIAGMAALLSGLCYAEFSARFPVSGSAYTFAYLALGEWLAWVVGWCLTLEYGLCAAAVAAGWSQYMQALFQSAGVDFPDALVQWHVPGTAGILVLNPLALLLVIICTLLSLRSVKDFGKITIYMTVFNVLIISFFILAGSFFVDTSNYEDFMPYGFSGTISGAATSFFSYIGFDCVSNFSAEVKNPRKAIPIGLFVSLSIVTVLYCGVGIVVTGMQNYTLIDETAPLAKAFDYHGQSWASILVSIGSLTCTTFVTLGGVIGQPRIFYAMAHDGLLFSQFGVLDKRHVPAFGTMVTGATAGALALLVDFTVLADLVSAGTLLAFCVVCAGSLVNKMESPAGDAPKKSLTLREALYRKRGHISTGYFMIGAFVFFLLYTYKVLEGALSIGVGAAAFLGIPFLMVVYCFYFTVTDKTPLPFAIPLMPYVPMCGIAVNAYLFSGLGWKSLASLGGWTLLGQCIYLGYGVWHSKVRYHRDPNSKAEIYGSEGGIVDPFAKDPFPSVKDMTADAADAADRKQQKECIVENDKGDNAKVIDVKRPVRK